MLTIKARDDRSMAFLSLVTDQWFPLIGNRSMALLIASEGQEINRLKCISGPQGTIVKTIDGT